MSFRSWGWWQGWRSGESAHLPPMWPGFDSRTRRHMWVEFVVGSLLCSERFFSEYSGFPLSLKTNISKFQFNIGTHRHFWKSSCELLGAPCVEKFFTVTLHLLVSLKDCTGFMHTLNVADTLVKFAIPPPMMRIFPEKKIVSPTILQQDVKDFISVVASLEQRKLLSPQWEVNTATLWAVHGCSKHWTSGRFDFYWLVLGSSNETSQCHANLEIPNFIDIQNNIT